jgi:hypothetical protein
MPDTAQGGPLFLRSFDDENGGRWEAGIRERPGPDYKGRFYLVMQPAGADSLLEVALDDVRWNSEDDSMSPVELRRRLRSARNRAART